MTSTHSLSCLFLFLQGEAGSPGQPGADGARGDRGVPVGETLLLCFLLVVTKSHFTRLFNVVV